MAEETDQERGAAAGGVDPAALGVALSGASRDKADAFLEEQTILTRLQAEEISREDKLRHWSLRVRHVSDVMKLAFELSAAMILLTIVVFVGAAIWMAAHDNSLVIEAFTVPPDMAARGLTGQAVAAQLEDKLIAMQGATDTARPANSYLKNWGDDIRVQIPDTGISISELYRALAAWLGHQTRISGEVYRSRDDIAITARAGGAGSTTVYGSDAKLPALVQLIAEALYSMTQPYRYGVYRETNAGAGDPGAIFRKLSVEGETSNERAWAYNGIATWDTIRFADLYAAVADYRRAIAIKPDFALAWSNVGEYETTLGHDQAALDAYRQAQPLIASNLDMTARAAGVLLPVSRAAIASELGDFETTRRALENASARPDYSNTVEQAREDIIVALAQMHDGQNARKAFAALPLAKNALTRAARRAVKFWVTSSSDDWTSTLKQEPEVERAFQAAGLNTGIDGNALVVLRARRIWPAAGLAFAESGNFVSAHALIDRTPRDCYLCIRMRGKIDAAEKAWSGAAFWFAEAVRQAPSLPFAETDWGEALMAKGDVDGAIVKFEIAHAKGPHFADPLEMWGDALMLKNRSDLALAKLEEANKYAPNWGRLHLKWGEALYWSGHKDEARKQFAIATHLDLSAADKAALTSVVAMLGSTQESAGFPP